MQAVRKFAKKHKTLDTATAQMLLLRHIMYSTSKGATNLPGNRLRKTKATSAYTYLVRTLSGDRNLREVDMKVRFSRRGRTLLNRARVLEYIECKNAHVYIIDRVLPLPVAANLVFRSQTVGDLVFGEFDSQTNTRTRTNLYNGVLDRFINRAERAIDFVPGNGSSNVADLSKLGRIGPLRSNYLVFAPTNEAFQKHAAAVQRYVRQREDQNPDADIIREHICKVDTITDRSMLLARAKEQAWTCTNLNGNTLTVSLERYERSEHDDGLRVNGAQVYVPPMIDVLARNGAVVTIADVLLPVEG